MNFPRFTAWMGNNSTTNKQKRVLGELQTLFAAGGHCVSDRAAVRQVGSCGAFAQGTAALVGAQFTANITAKLVG